MGEVADGHEAVHLKIAQGADEDIRVAQDREAHRADEFAHRIGHQPQADLVEHGVDHRIEFEQLVTFALSFSGAPEPLVELSLEVEEAVQRIFEIEIFARPDEDQAQLALGGVPAFRFGVDREQHLAVAEETVLRQPPDQHAGHRRRAFHQGDVLGVEFAAQFQHRLEVDEEAVAEQPVPGVENLRTGRRGVERGVGQHAETPPAFLEAGQQLLHRHAVHRDVVVLHPEVDLAEIRGETGDDVEQAPARIPVFAQVGAGEPPR